MQKTPSISFDTETLPFWSTIVACFGYIIATSCLDPAKECMRDT